MVPTPRMSDVAEMAGVSTMTVSRVLNEHPSVSNGVRKRVLAAVERLRYQPNELARSLREQRSRQIGILVPYLFDPFFAACAHAISTVAMEHSYSVVLSTSNEDPGAELTEATQMVRRNVEGLVVIPARIMGKAKSLLLGYQFERTPMIALDRPIEGSNIDHLLVENKGGARTGTEHLISLGHRRIVFLTLSIDLYTMRMRRLGYREGMKAACLTPQITVLSDDLESTRIVLAKLLSGARRPTAVLCANNLITRHVLHCMQGMGIHPPQSVALVGFDDFDTADLLRPGVTTIRQPVEILGRTAAEMLFARLKGGKNSANRTPLHVVLPVEFVIRGTCGAELKRRRHGLIAANGVTS